MAKVGTSAAKAPVVLAETEAYKPIGVRADDGDFVTLVQYRDEPTLSKNLTPLDSLTYEKQAALTIARLQYEPADVRVRVLGREVFSRDDMIREVEAGSPIGRRFVQIERAWVERLKDKVGKGEYRLRVRAQASASTSQTRIGN